MIATAIAAIRTFAAALFLIVIVPIAALIAFPWTFITRKADFLYFVGMGLAHLAVRIAGTRIKLVGLDQFDSSGTYIFMSNHVSNLDPPTLISVIPGRTSAFMKRSLMNLPILGTGFRQGEFIAVDRSGNPADAQLVARRERTCEQRAGMVSAGPARVDALSRRIAATNRRVCGSRSSAA